MAFDGFTGGFDLERAAQLQTLAREYHERCEDYDRTVCTGGTNRAGEAMPGNGHELGMINRYASLVQQETLQRGAALGFSPEEVRRAIRKAG